MRINAYLSLSGVASRRKADEFIKAGRVTINGKTAQLNSQVSDHDKVKLDGKLVAPAKFSYVLLNKPTGVITTMSDPEGRPKVNDLVKAEPGLKPVGRLDVNTSGVILLTNDGQLANALMHPSREFKKTYSIEIEGKITQKILDLLSNGLELEDGMTAPAEAIKINERTIRLTIHEGKNRQVRRMMEVVGLKVKKLERSAYGPLSVGQLKRGHWRYLSASEVNLLKAVKIKSNES